MDWKKERDLLIAQTLAFVQSVTGKTPDPKPTSLEQNSLVRQTSLEQTSPEQAPDVEEPLRQVAQVLGIAPITAAKLDEKTVEPKNTPAAIKDIQLSIQMPRSIVSSDIRNEMQARVTNFRAHQERFHREREEYFSTTLRQARAAIGPTADPRATPAAAKTISKIPGDSRSSESGQGPS